MFHGRLRSLRFSWGRKTKKKWGGLHKSGHEHTETQHTDGSPCVSSNCSSRLVRSGASIPAAGEQKGLKTMVWKVMFTQKGGHVAVVPSP